MKRFRILLLTLVSINYSLAQEVDTISYNLSTPYDAILTHLQYLQPESYKPIIAAKALRFNDQDKRNKISLAIKLKQIFDGSGVYIELEDYSRETNYKDSISNRSEYC